ncbi:MAG: B3/4 domain-containing protein [Bacillota bacterium]
MRFFVDNRFFEQLPDVCFGIVVAKGLDNHGESLLIDRLLQEQVALVRLRFAGVNIKESPEISCYREAFKKLGINPNKFMSSVEAMVTRISKGGELPSINKVVNLVNALSLKYILPMGAHDVNRLSGSLGVKVASGTERFVPLGQVDPEPVEPGEIVYADEGEVRTRRWIWRQGDGAKVTQDSTNIFFPIDGFAGVNGEAVLAARNELADLLAEVFGCRVKTGWIDSRSREEELG